MKYHHYFIVEHMIKYSILSLTIACLLFLFDHQYIASKPTKKIIIDSSNNHVLDDGYFYLTFPTSFKKKEVQALREHVLQRVRVVSTSELKTIQEILTWVNGLWKHDGSMSPPNMSSLDILKAAEQGRSFSCIEYSNVYTDVLHSLGYICRTIGVTTSDIAYGGMGVGHTLCEVWSNELNKWILVDPQFGFLIKYKHSYVSYLEFHQALSKKNVNDIQIEAFVNGKHGFHANEDLKSQYLDFIKRYQAFLMFSMKVTGKDVMYVLPLQAQTQFLTSQGGNSKPLIFLTDTKQAYFSLNRTHLLFDFNIASADVGSIVANEEVHSQEDFSEKMSEHVAIPDFTVYLSNNMPWFSHYEIQINQTDMWERLNGHEFQLRLREGKNEISVRSVNQAGVIGVTTRLVLRYQ